MTKTKLPSAYGGLAAVQTHLQKADLTAAQKALKQLISDLSTERAIQNAEIYQYMGKFVKRVLSSRGKKTPEEVAALATVLKMLLKR